MEINRTVARIRTIKPEFFRHSGLYDLEKQTQLPLRIAFAGLWTVCDREGRFPWRPRELKTEVLPYDDVDFAFVLEYLNRAGFVVHYVVDGQAFGCIPSWKKHQVINYRERKSTIPAPPDDISKGDLLDPPGFVYFAWAPIAKLLKVGFCSRDPRERVAQLSTGSPEEIELIDAIPGRQSTEKEVHAALEPWKARREWFKLTPESFQRLDAWSTRVRDALGGTGKEVELEKEKELEGGDASTRQKPTPPTTIPAISIDTPRDLTQLEYARRLLSDLGMPEKGNIVVVADSIKAYSTARQTSLPAAFEQMRAIALDARDRGDPLNHFWFQDARYLNPRRKSKTEVATDEFHERFDRERQIIARANIASA